MNTCKTFRACSYLLYMFLASSVGYYRYVRRLPSFASLVGGSFEVHEHPPASPTPSGLRITKLCLQTIVFVSVLSCLKCASCFRARGAHATRTPPCSTRLPRVQTAATSALSDCHRRDHTPPSCRSPLRLSLCRRLGLLQDQLAPCSCTPPATLLCAPLEIPLLDRPQPTLSALRRYSGDDARSRHFLGLVAGQAVTALAA